MRQTSNSGFPTSKLAVQERYNQSRFLGVLLRSLQGIAVRPLPCNYYVIFHGGNTGSNPVGDANWTEGIENGFKRLTLNDVRRFKVATFTSTNREG